MVMLFFATIFASVAAITYFLLRNTGAAAASVLGAISKFFLCVAGVFVVLPFGGEDATTFHETALAWSDLRFSEILSTFDLSRSYNYVTLVSMSYRLFEQNIAIPVFVNGTIGVLIYYHSIRLVTIVWPGIRLPQSLFLILALHPMLSINSAVVLRENIIILFLVLATIQAVKFSRRGQIGSAALCVVYTLLSAAFHGGMLVFLAGVFFAGIGAVGRGWIPRVVGGVVVLVALIFVLGNVEVAKLGTLQEQGLTSEFISEQDSNRREAGTAYLTGMNASGIVDVVWQSPIRSFFFLATPFPWNVRSLGHLFAMVDAAIWWMIIYLSLKNIRSILSNPASRIILFGVLVLIVLFAFGTTNFGTALRHRTKFLVLGLVLVAPYLPRKKLTLRP